jgi:amino acid permease
MVELLERKGAGVLSTALMIVCQMAGIGILQLPYMLRQSGWVCLGFIVVCAAASNFTGKLLLRSCYSGAGERVSASYADLGFAAFGRPGRFVAVAAENATLAGVGTLFLILAAKFLAELFPSALSLAQWTALCATAGGIPVLACGSVAELKGLPAIGVLATTAVVLAVLYTAVTTGASEPVQHHWLVPEGLIPTFSALSLSLAAHAGLPAVEGAMREPAKFPKALNVAYGMILSIYLAIAGAGYAVYGDGVYSPILCSLPHGGWIQAASKAMVTVHVVLTYPVLVTLFVGNVEASFGIRPEVPMFMEKRTLLRLCVVAATAAVAATVPYFDTVMSLVGALCVVLTAFVLPCLFYIKLVAETWSQRAGPLLVAGLCTAAGAVGVVQAATELLEKLETHADPSAR